MVFDDPFALEYPLESSENTAPDWFAAKLQVERDATRVDEAIAADIVAVQRKAARLLNQHVRSHIALNRALAEVFAFAQRHRDRPADVIAALRRAGQPLTRATLGSPYLPYIRLLMPTTDPRLQSRYATGLAYVAAHGAHGDVALEIADRGGIESCARAYARSRRPEAKKCRTVGDPLAGLRNAVTPHELSVDLTPLLPNNPGGALLLVERDEMGRTVAFGCIQDTRLLKNAASHVLASLPERS